MCLVFSPFEPRLEASAREATSWLAERVCPGSRVRTVSCVWKLLSLIINAIVARIRAASAPMFITRLCGPGARLHVLSSVPSAGEVAEATATVPGRMERKV